MWKTIDGFSNYEVNEDGEIRNAETGIVFSQHKNNRGYPMVRLTDNDGNRHTVTVHRLVAKTFIPNPNEYPVVNHKDENKANNKVSNLEWCTAEYNRKYKDAFLKCQKPVVAFDDNGNIVARYNGANDAAKEGYSFSKISSCCHGTRKTTGGLHWRFE